MWQVKQLLEVSVSASNTCGDIRTCDIQWYTYLWCFHVAIICGMSIVPLNTTSVSVSWTPVNLTVVNHYTVHYTTMGGVNGTVSFPATSSSGVVSELQGGQEYWFSVTVTLNVSGKMYSRSPDYRPIAYKHPTLHTCMPTYTCTTCCSFCLCMWNLFHEKLVHIICSDIDGNITHL